MVAVKPYIALLRIVSWRGFFLMAIFGFIISEAFLSPLINIAVFFIIFFLFLGSSFAINDCSDVKEDKLGKKSNPIARGEISLKKAIIFSISLGGLGLILSAYFGMEVFLFYSALIFLSFIYSLPPLRLKSRFLLDILSHGLFFGSFLFFLPIIIFNMEPAIVHYLIAISIFWFSVIIELKNHLRDYESDKKAGLKTTVCVLGKSKSEVFLKVLEITYPLTLALVFLFSENFWLMILFAAVSCLSLSRRNKKVNKCEVKSCNALRNLIFKVWKTGKYFFHTCCRK